MPPPCTPPHWKPDKPALDALEAQISDSIPGRDSFGCHLDGDRKQEYCEYTTLHTLDYAFGCIGSPNLRLYTGTGLIWMHWKPKTMEIAPHRTPSFEVLIFINHICKQEILRMEIAPPLLIIF